MTEITAAYGYDAGNRLASGAATGNSTYSQSYAYDAWGNLNCSPAGPGCVALSYSSSNRISTSGYTYDAAGNLIGDGTHTYQWDAEAHLTVAYLSGTAVQTNTYNALGQRVRDVTQTNTTDEACGADGALLWRYTGSSSDPNQCAFVPFSDGILAEYYSKGKGSGRKERGQSLCSSGKVGLKRNGARYSFLALEKVPDPFLH